MLVSPASLNHRPRLHVLTKERVTQSVSVPVFVAVWALSCAARADGAPSIVTVPPILHDGLSTSARAHIDQGFQRALRKASTVTAAQEECSTESCWHDLAIAQHADVVAFYCAALDGRTGLCDPRRHVETSADIQPHVELPQRHRLAVVVYSPVTKLVTSASVGCDACTASEAADRLQGLTETLLRATAQTDAVGSLSLHGIPNGGLVFVDGVLRAQSESKPIVLTLGAAQTHRIEVYSSKYSPYREPALRIEAGSSMELAIQMTPLPDGPQGRREDESTPESPAPPVAGYGYHTQPPVWRWALPLVLMGAGGLMLGFGGRAMALRGSCTEQAGCPLTYNTEQVGLGLIGAGGALAGIGGITLAFGVQKVYVRVPPSSD